MRTPDDVEPGCISDVVTVKVGSLSGFLQSCFKLSSRKDQLIDLVRGSLVEGLWSELDRWSDRKRFQALDVLQTIIHPENEVLATFF